MGKVEDFLEHYGVKGMHWGIRKARERRQLSKEERKKAHTEFKEIEKLRKKKISELSTADLKRLNDRANAENNFRRLNQSKISKGRAVIAGILIGAATTEAQRVVSSHLRKRGESFVAKRAFRKTLTTPAKFVVKQGSSFI